MVYMAALVLVLFSVLFVVQQQQKKDGMTLNSLGLVVVVLFGILGILSEVPSISIDLNLIFSYASDIVNMMTPIVGVGAGISFGFALVAYIIRLFRQIF